MFMLAEIIVTYALMHGYGERAPLKQPCGDQMFAYLVQNIDAIETIVVGDGELVLKTKASSTPIRASRVLGTRGFFDVNDRVSLYVAVEPGKSTAAIGILSRRDGVAVCAEKWRGKVSRLDDKR